MNRRSMGWRVVAGLWTVVNFGGGVYAVATGEWMHAAVHVGLLLGGYFVWQLLPRGELREPAAIPQTEGQIEYLQQSVDAIALEVERIGEAQRFSEKIRAEQRESPPPDKPK